MSSFDFSEYDYEDTTPVQIKKKEPVESSHEKQKNTMFDFEEYDLPKPTSNDQEGFFKSAARTALQVPQGIGEGTLPGILTGLWQLLASGEVNDPEEIERIKTVLEREGIPFDEEAYRNAGQTALSYVPTVSNIGREIESRTGIPLEPKNRVQKGLRFASTATKLAPEKATLRPLNTSLPKPVLGASVEATKEVLQEAGLPEPLAELASFAVLKTLPEGSPSISVGKEPKPSGLTTHNYEKLEKPFEVSPRKFNKINQKVESEVRDLTKKIMEKSPVSETFKGLAEDITFKKNAREAFKDVDAIAEGLPQTFETKSIKSDLENVMSKKKTEGLTPSEFDKSHGKFIDQYIKELPEGNASAGQLVKQYRKNNSQLGEAYEPGQSFAYNRAKREALLDYNRAIANMIEKQFPGSEFSKLFKETNKRWADINNAEAVTGFLDELFKGGKTQFKKARQLFDKEGMTVPFKRAMGEEGFSNFETLLNDLMSTEKGMKLLKAAEGKGFADLSKTAGAYILDPNLAYAKLGLQTIKGGYNKIFEMLLDKPSIAIRWDRGINAMKRGNFKAAEREFKTVHADEIKFDSKEKSRADALKKFNEIKTISQKPNK